MQARAGCLKYVKPMGFQTIVHGKIIAGADMARNKAVIDSLQDQQPFPWIMTEMFGVPQLESPHYYENQVITFGASYKQLDDDLTGFLMKFEHILSQLDFRSAKIEIESEIFPIFYCFWKSKHNDTPGDEEKYISEGLYVTDQWYYGYGQRNVWGMRENEEHIAEETSLLQIANAVHPYLIKAEDEAVLRELLDFLEPGVITYFYSLPQKFQKAGMYEAITKFALENEALVWATHSGYEVAPGNQFGPYLLLKKRLKF